MPPRKYARRKRTYRRKKRTFKRTKYYKKRRLNARPVGTMLTGVPSQRMIKMRFVQTNILASVAGTLAQQTFRWNSIYDPDYTGTGATALGYDMWSKMYNHYTVMATKLRTHWTFYNSDGVPIYYGLFNQAAPAALSTNPDFLDGQGMGKIRMCQGHVYGGNNDKELSLYWRAKKWFNIADVKDNQDRLGADFGANPPSTGDAYVSLYFKSGSGQCNAYVKSTFTFYVLLSDPIPLSV